MKRKLFYNSLCYFLIFYGCNINAYSQDTVNATDKKGLKQGKWIGKYENGKKRYEGFFSNGKPSGLFIYYYESGEKNAELNFSEDGKKASARYYHLNGMVMGKGNYLDQKKDSVWLYYDDREILSQEENYANGKKEGISRIFYLDGSVAEIKNYRNNTEHGTCKQYFKGGKTKYEAVYVDGNPDGKVIYYHPSGIIKSSGIYADAVKDGEWISYNEDGSVFSREFFDKGISKKFITENGVFSTQYPSGSLKEEYTYKNGEKNGVYKEYCDITIENRQPADTSRKAMEEWETIYSDVKMFDDQHVPVSPKIKKMGNYLNGKLDGELVYYHTSGAIEKIEIYKDGQLVGKK